MVPEFVIWLFSGAVLAVILERTTDWGTVPCLIATAAAAAAVLTVIDIIRNSRFRAPAKETEATVTHILPPLRTGGLARAEITCTVDGKKVVKTVTPEETPKPGGSMTVFVWGRRVLAQKPTRFADFRPLVICACAMVLLALAFLCTKLMPQPKARP